MQIKNASKRKYIRRKENIYVEKKINASKCKLKMRRK